jgi:hypothetical protein
MKIQKILLYFFGFIAGFSLFFLLQRILANIFVLSKIHIPDTLYTIAMILVLIISITLPILVAKRYNSNRRVSILLTFFVLFDIVSYSLYFSIVPTPTFCHMVVPEKSIGNLQCGVWGCSPPPIPPPPSPYMECGHSVLSLENWKDKSFHIEWNSVQYHGHLKKKS